MSRPFNEFSMIETYFAPLAEGRAEALGLGDDAAVIAVPAGEEMVVTTDALAENRHFLERTAPADIAHKSLAVNLSDLAAMGARPMTYTLALALPEGASEDWVSAFASGLKAIQQRHGVFLCGGDTVSMGGGPLTISITAMGLVPEGRALRRGGAEAGDDIYVSGTIGDGVLGLYAARDGRDWGPATDALIARHLRPEPRTGLGPALVNVASACLDVSDGLVADAGHIAEQSGLGIEIEAARVPLSDAAREVVGEAPDLIEAVLTGGDDYELVFTAPPEKRAEIESVAVSAKIPVTRIGRAEAGEGVRVLGPGGETMPLKAGGFRHF